MPTVTVPGASKLSTERSKEGMDVDEAVAIECIKKHCLVGRLQMITGSLEDYLEFSKPDLCTNWTWVGGRKVCFWACLSKVPNLVCVIHRYEYQSKPCGMC